TQLLYADTPFSYCRWQGCEEAWTSKKLSGPFFVAAASCRETLMLKRYLLTPGPTPVPPEVLLRMSQPLIHHRTPEFSQLFAEVQAGLRWLFCTEQDVLIL